jgi:DNA-binding MarR family transcriptional regulator
MTHSYSLYEEAQILIAGVRLFQHREGRMPSVRELSEFTRFSVESVYHLCNRLEKLGVLEKVRGAFDERISLKDPLQAEMLRQEENAPDIGEDVKKWKEHHQGTIQEVEKRFSEGYGKKEKEELYSKLQEKLRKGGREEKESPLDALFRKKDPAEKE